MGTNFNWIFTPATLPTGELVPVDSDSPIIHIGKRYAAQPRGAGFILAQPLATIISVCEANPDDWVAVDEYGDKYTGVQLKAILDRCSPIIADSIGTRFS